MRNAEQQITALETARAAAAKVVGAKANKVEVAELIAARREFRKAMELCSEICSIPDIEAIERDFSGAF